MNTFPLVRKSKWSNEHIMTAVFIVSVLYLLPVFVKNPIEILYFIAVLIFGLFIDAAANIMRHKRMVCSVSAAVTCAVLYGLAAGVPLWGKLVGIFAALLAGKHFWGGTGKNGINPAVVGLLLISVLFSVKFPIFAPSSLLLPAAILSLPFIVFRPYASISFMTGIILSLYLTNGFSVSYLLTYGIVFWGCIIVTDPVTVTKNPVIGCIGGFLSGFLPFMVTDNLWAAAICVLIFNIVSFTAERIIIKDNHRPVLDFKIDRIMPFSKQDTKVYDLTGRNIEKSKNSYVVSDKGFLDIIKKNEVYGFGGAAFPTYDKIKAVIESEAKEKHLIINGVECDPGLIHDKWVMRQYPDEIYAGIELLGRNIKFKTVTLTVKDDNGLHFPDGLKIYKVRDYYPAGAEKILIKEVLGIDIPQDIVTAKYGILVLNVQTVYSIYEAVYMNKRADTKYITAADVNKNNGCVVKVKLGDNVHNVLQHLYPSASVNSEFVGGGFMQCHVSYDGEVIDKSTNFIALSDMPKFKESPNCSSCGLCSSNCPMGLKVNMIADIADSGKLDMTKKYHPERCINCGICSYICLAGRNLSSKVKNSKEYLNSRHC